jgi:FMN phosphatase YigB (HAD superfamily)
VDDQEENVRGAERAGLQACIFTTPEALREVWHI